MVRRKWHYSVLGLEGGWQGESGLELLGWGTLESGMCVGSQHLMGSPGVARAPTTAGETSRKGLFPGDCGGRVQRSGQPSFVPHHHGSCSDLWAQGVGRGDMQAHRPLQKGLATQVSGGHEDRVLWL